MDLRYWNVIREGGNVWATYQVYPGYIYDPLISCLANNPKELDSLCSSVLSKTWGNQEMADELREVVESLEQKSLARSTYGD